MDKGYYQSQPPQYPQQAAYGQPAYPPAQPGYPPQQPYGAPQPGYYAQPSPQPQVIIQQQAPPPQKNDDMCMGCALGACLCCCLEGCC